MAGFWVGSILFPEPTIFNLSLLAIIWLLPLTVRDEATGKSNVPYGKFSHGVAAARKVSGRLGMVLMYSLGLAASLAGAAYLLLQVLQHQGVPLPSGLTDTVALVLSSRPLFVAALLVVHFTKREAESLCVHQYSGTTPLPTVAFIAVNYLVIVLATLYSVTQISPQLYAGGPSALGVSWAVLVGGTMFVIGQLGNGYHHWLLARLRAGGGQDAMRYKVPQGGLFSWVTCPHYLFELVTWWGIAVASQHILVVGIAAGMTAFLCARSVAVKRWYLAKLEDYPKERRCLLPLIF